MDPQIVDSLVAERDDVKKATQIDSLLKSKTTTVKELAGLLSLSPSYICNIRRLVKLPELVTDGYYAGTISSSHLRILSRLPNEEEIILAYQKILERSLNTQETEELVREMLYKIEPGGIQVTALVKDKIALRFANLDPASKISVVQTRVRTRIVVDLYGGLRKTSRFLQKLSDS